MKKPYTGRLAPSPTGYLHLGNVFAFLIAWLDARSSDGRLILRMEDVDPDRSKKEFSDMIRRDLDWLGLTWDEETPPQSSRKDAYMEALEALSSRGLVYPCFCSRKELRSLAGAPQAGDAGAAYPGTCRSLNDLERKVMIDSGRASCLRLDCSSRENDPWVFEDRVQGPQSITLNACGGDFALMRSDNVFAYQLAVAVDDMESNVTHVVRGMDILPSTPRQLYLYELLNRPPPVYAHLPLIADSKGERLAKRHKSLSVKSLRESGIRSETLIGFLAFLSGLSETGGDPMSPRDLLKTFALTRLSKTTLQLPSERFFGQA